MTHINRSALVNYSAEQMFALVNDIESYPQFMQGCVAAKVISRSEQEVVGQLTLARAGFRQTITTRNRLVPGREMQMELIEGAFRNFNATWHFEPLTESACKVSLNMSFAFSMGLMDFAMEKLFSSSANNLVDALVKRAHAVYGDGK